MPVGNGRVIIDQAQLGDAHTNIVGGSPQRVISMLLTNLGVVHVRPMPSRPCPPA